MSDRLDAEAVSRVLRRAHQIEVERRIDDDPTSVEPQVLIEAAADVGIDPDAVRDSLAIERMPIDRPPVARLDRLAGPEVLVVERQVRLTVGEALASVERWLTTGYRMRCRRDSDGVVLARRRSGGVAALGRAVAGARGEGRLAGVDAIRVVAVPLSSRPPDDRPSTLVRVEAQRSRARRSRIGGGGAVGAAGVVAGSAAALDVALVLGPVVAVPALGAGVLVAASGARQADRSDHDLECLLADVAAGDEPTGLLGRAARQATRALARSPRRAG